MSRKLCRLHVGYIWTSQKKKWNSQKEEENKKLSLFLQKDRFFGMTFDNLLEPKSCEPTPVLKKLIWKNKTTVLWFPQRYKKITVDCNKHTRKKKEERERKFVLN